MSPLGPLLLVAEKGNLVYCNWKEPECSKKEKRIIGDAVLEESLAEHKILEKTEAQLDEYFKGERQRFELPVKLMGTEFQIKVWQNIMNVPYGGVASYKSLALAAGSEKGYRAVAQACGNNPVAVIVPCHRIVASDGKMGGYTGGRDKKEWLLKHETH